MTMQFVRATRKQLKARVAIDGPSGAGKTYTALVLATALAGANGKIAVIDTERGSAKLYSDKFGFDVLELQEFSPVLYTQAIETAEHAGYQVVVIDSLTHAWEGEGGALDLVDKAAARVQGNSYVAWRDVTPLHRKMVDTILQSNCHIVATMRSKMDYVQERDEQKGKTIIRKVGMAPIQRQGIEYEFTIVGDMDIDHHFVVSKSRCDLMADKVFTKPTAKDFEPFVKWLDSGDVSPKVEYKPAEQKPAPKDEKPATPYHTEGGDQISSQASNPDNDQFAGVCTEDGIPYCDLKMSDLANRFNSLSKLKAKDPGAFTAENQRKLDAVNHYMKILRSRSATA